MAYRVPCTRDTVYLDWWCKQHRVAVVDTSHAVEVMPPLGPYTPAWGAVSQLLSFYK